MIFFGFYSRPQFSNTLYWKCSLDIVCYVCSLHAAVPLLEEPSFVRMPESIEATQGDTVKFSCKAMGKPIPSVLWFRGDKKLPGVPKHKVEIEEKKTEEKNLIESVLTVKDVKLNVHDGAYLVQAENEAGCIAQEAQLVGKPRAMYSHSLHAL